MKMTQWQTVYVPHAEHWLVDHDRILLRIVNKGNHLEVKENDEVIAEFLVSALEVAKTYAERYGIYE